MKAPETKRRIASGELGPIKPAQGKRASTRATASQGPRSGGIANPWTARINDAYQKTVEAVFEIGRLLIQARDDLPDGEFQRMVARDLPFKARWARMYMEVARSPFLSKRQYTAVLPSSVETLALLGKLSEQEFTRRMAAGEIHSGTTGKKASAMAKGQQTAMLDDPTLRLSGLGRELERAIEHDQYAPHWLKLEKASREIIEEFASSIAKLKRYVGRVGEPDGLEQFRAEFARMEKAITERIEKYRQLTIFMKRLLAHADASLRHVPED